MVAVAVVEPGAVKDEFLIVSPIPGALSGKPDPEPAPAPAPDPDPDPKNPVSSINQGAISPSVPFLLPSNPLAPSSSDPPKPEPDPSSVLEPIVHPDPVPVPMVNPGVKAEEDASEKGIELPDP